MKCPPWSVNGGAPLPPSWRGPDREAISCSSAGRSSFTRRITTFFWVSEIGQCGLSSGRVCFDPPVVWSECRLHRTPRRSSSFLGVGIERTAPSRPSAVATTFIMKLRTCKRGSPATGVDGAVSDSPEAAALVAPCDTGRKSNPIGKPIDGVYSLVPSEQRAMAQQSASSSWPPAGASNWTVARRKSSPWSSTYGDRNRANISRHSLRTEHEQDTEPADGKDSKGVRRSRGVL